MSQGKDPEASPCGDAAAPSYFEFESDFVDSLRCIPMVVRLRLDVSGVKLKLNEWSKLGKTERCALAESPCVTGEEITAFRESLSGMVEQATGSRPSLLADLPEPVWDRSDAVPAQVIEQAGALGLAFPVRAWAALRPLQRFALVKLSRPGHENRNFLPAMKEFGLAP
jgi:hypothetical protein